MNKIRMTYAFSRLNEKGVLDKVLSSVNLANHLCPYDMYAHKIENIKSFNYPFVKETYESLKNRSVIPMFISDTVKPLPQQTTDLLLKIPPYMFNFTTGSGNGPFVTAINMDLKGGYKRAKTTGSVGQAETITVDDRSFFHYASLGYVINRLFDLDKSGSLKSADDFAKQIAGFYSLLMGKCLDRNFTMNNTDALDYLYYLCACFCLESMFGYDKKSAMNVAKKIKFINADNPVIKNSSYVMDDSISMVANCDYKETFPIMNFTEIMMNEFSSFRPSRFSKDLLLIYFTNMYGLNSFLAVESLIGVITMYMLSKAKMKLYTDFVIDKNIEMIKNDLNRVFTLFLSK